jgi:hypothetical protein
MNTTYNADTRKPTTNDVRELTSAELEAIAGGGQAVLTPAQQRAAKQHDDDRYGRIGPDPFAGLPGVK